MAELGFSTDVNYQKIYVEGSVNLSIANPLSRTSTTIFHNLGNTPNVRVWWLDGSNRMVPAFGGIVGGTLLTSVSAFTDLSCYYEIYPNSLKVYFDRGVTVGATKSTTIYYRVYLDTV